MEAILILVIISIQFSLIYFGVKYLSSLNDRLVLLNQKIEQIFPLISPNFQLIRNYLSTTNQLMTKYIENKDKIKILRLILLIYSLIIAITIFKRKKNIFSIYSLYDCIVSTTKAILGF